MEPVGWQDQGHASVEAGVSAVDTLLPLLGDRTIIRAVRNSWDNSVSFRASTAEQARTHQQARNLMPDRPPALLPIVLYGTDFRPVNEIVRETFKAIGAAVVEPLIVALDNPAKRVPAAMALEAITGQRFYVAGPRRAPAPPIVDVAAWQKWWQQNRHRMLKDQ